MEIHPGEEGMKETFPHSRKASHRHVCGEFCNLRGQHNWKKKKQKAKPTDMHLTTTTSRDREVAWMLGSATSELGLGREAWAAHWS